MQKSPPLIVLAVGLVVLGLIFVPLERWLGPVRGQKLWQPRRLPDVFYWFVSPVASRALAIFTLSGAVFAIAAFTGLPADLWAFAASIRAHIPWGRAPKWVLLLVALLIGDFFQYWVHRWFHGRALWAFHAVHHSPKELDWLSSVRTHPVNDLSNKLAMSLPILFLGVDLQLFAVALPFLQLLTILEHANLPFSYGPLRYVVNSPRYHRWHHATDGEASGKNFAGMFPLWDIIFGTFYLPHGVNPLHFGVPDPVPEGFVGQLVYPVKGWKAVRRAAAVAAVFGLGLSDCRSATLGVPTASLGDLPAANPPAEMTISTIMTGATHSPAWLTFDGGSLSEERRLVMPAVLVHHPKGDLLIDAGFSRDVLDHVPWAIRQGGKVEVGTAAGEQLRAAGYDLGRLSGVVPTHVHWDHIAGLAELPGVPVWLNPEEQRYVAQGGRDSALMRSYKDVEIRGYDFAHRSYLGFERSDDVFGDGSVVLVPAPGHTPGSIVAFVSLPSGKRYAFIGDLAWQREGVFLPAEKPWIMRAMVDWNPAAVRVGLQHLAQIRAQFPTLFIVPAHDEKAMMELPQFPLRGG